MLEASWFFEQLQTRQVGFFTGVPDSLLKEFCAYVSDQAPSNQHIITANEGNAIALAAGYHLATGKVGLVYMQNSGLGNAVNPLTSLTDPAVYGIPMLLLIGWRGEPGVQDEPQHIKQGAITPSLLDALGLSYSIMPMEKDAAQSCLDTATQIMRAENRPYALLVRKGSFAKYASPITNTNNYPLSREEAIQQIARSLGNNDIVVATTGMISRELFEYRASGSNQDLGRDFLTVGSMGHASQIALGIALQKPDRDVYCLDGDGALIMHMGSMALIGSQLPQNYKHVVLNNGAHDSVGGQPTAAFNIDISSIALNCGYRKAHQVNNMEELADALKWLGDARGPVMLEVRVGKGARTDLGRPTTTPTQNKQSFMKHLAE
jgi:phosphonopyruvate decarboxylase